MLPISIKLKQDLHVWYLFLKSKIYRLLNSILWRNNKKVTRVVIRYIPHPGNTFASSVNTSICTLATDLFSDFKSGITKSDPTLSLVFSFQLPPFFRRSSTKRKTRNPTEMDDDGVTIHSEGEDGFVPETKSKNTAFLSVLFDSGKRNITISWCACITFSQHFEFISSCLELYSGLANSE